jgi:predicted amidohydrolase YtcJ
VNQPRYLYDSGDEFLTRLGHRAHGLQPLRQELAAGITVVLSSDSDVASYRPLEQIASAIERRTRAGAPIGPDQRLSLEEAMLSYTIDAAFALRLEDRIGSLEPGKLADVAVIDGDLVAAPPGDLGSFAAWKTFLGGQLVHDTEAAR